MEVEAWEGVPSAVTLASPVAPARHGRAGGPFGSPLLGVTAAPVDAGPSRRSRAGAGAEKTEPAGERVPTDPAADIGRAGTSLRLACLSR